MNTTTVIQNRVSVSDGKYEQAWPATITRMSLAGYHDWNEDMILSGGSIATRSGLVSQ